MAFFDDIYVKKPVNRQCNIPILEVVPMVEYWIQSGRAVWEGERLVIRKKKMQEPSEASRKSMTLWLLTRQKVVKACNVLKDILRVASVFWIGRYKDGSYDVVMRKAQKTKVARPLSDVELRKYRPGIFGVFKPSPVNRQARDAVRGMHP